MRDHRPDALDVLEDEGAKLRDLFARWDALLAKSREAATEATPSGNAQLIRTNFELGTIGKLLLEHAALVVAALEEVGRRLASHPLKQQLDELSEVARPLLDDLDTMNRGIAAVSLVTPTFGEKVELLRSALLAEGSPLQGPEVVKRLDSVLGSRRSTLRSARFVASHAPTHPGPRRWYSRIPLIVRLHSRYDRIRGAPWANSPNWADRPLAERYK